MLDTLLHAARGSEKQGFMWHHVGPLVATLFNEGSPISMKRVGLLVSPHLPWRNFTNGKQLTQLWVAAAPAVPYTQDIDQCVVETLFFIQSQDSLRAYLPVGVWSWLNRRPSLPPICVGRSLGTERDSIEMVRRLGDIETLTSYLLLVWSEWDEILSGFEEMRASIKEDFSGIGMWDHREELLCHLDHVLAQLSRGWDHLRQDRPRLPRAYIWPTKSQYKDLMETLLETDRKATEELIREPHKPALLFSLLTSADTRRMPLNVLVRDSASMSLAGRLNRSSPGARLHVSGYLIVAFARHSSSFPL